MPLQSSAADDATKLASAFFDTVFANVQGGTPCYGRSYDDAHIKEHPQQNVQRIEIDFDKASAGGVVNTPERFELGFALMLTTSSEWYGQVAICKAAADSADCYLEADGGRFKLTNAGDGALKLETGNYGIVIEGSVDAASLSGSEGDDRVFVLKPAREECDAATAYFKSGTEAD